MNQETSPRQELARSAPEEQGVASSAILAFVEAAERDALGLHSLMLLRHGAVIAEGWWTPYGPNDPHMLFSLSKSFTATAAGSAVAEGRFSLDDTVVSFFPDEAPADIEPNLAAMRVRHVLSMSTGHAEDTTGRMRDGERWVSRFLAQPVEHAPGTRFVYNSGATYLVSAIVQKATGQTVLDFLRPRLFGPLGIADPTWENSPQGINVGGWGLSVKTEDIARFGQLYLQKGMWQGRRLLPESWVEEATAKQVSNGADPDSDWTQGYGFQFWRCRHNAYRGDGAFGQFCLVLPEQDAVVAMTGGVGNLQAVVSLVWEHLLPAMTSAPRPADPAVRADLTGSLARLSVSVPSGGFSSPMAAAVSQKTFVFPASQTTDENAPHVEAVTWDFSDGKCVLTIRDGKGEHRVEAADKTWRRGTTTWRGNGEQPIAARGAWTDENTFAIKVCLVETPFERTLTARFMEDRVRLDIRQNVGFGPTEHAPQEGRRA